MHKTNPSCISVEVLEQALLRFNPVLLTSNPADALLKLQFNPMKPHILYAAYRASGTGSIYSWDIRSNVDVPIEIFHSPGSRMRKTNQKLRFDVDLGGRMLGVGDQVSSHVVKELFTHDDVCSFEQVGNISIFSIGDTGAVNQPYMDDGQPDPIIRSPALHFKANNGS